MTMLKDGSIHAVPEVAAAVITLQTLRRRHPFAFTDLRSYCLGGGIFFNDSVALLLDWRLITADGRVSPIIRSLMAVAVDDDETIRPPFVC